MSKTRFAAVLALATATLGIPVVLLAQGSDDTSAMTAFFKGLSAQTTTFGQFRFLSAAKTANDPQLQDTVAQMHATSLSFLGRPNEAIREFPLHDQDKASPGLPAPKAFEARPAADWIADQADRYRVVMVNEAHYKPQTRLLTLALLPELRRKGFRYLAIEALDDTPLAAGYPTFDTGYYTREPVFAELIREAVHLGYTLVPYESMEQSQQGRETGQAKRIAKILEQDPEAKILVHAGHGHISKEPGSQPDDANPMALEFMRLTGLPVLSIDQTRLTWEDGRASERLVSEFAISTPAILVSRSDRRAWSAYPKRFDATVVLPVAQSSKLRPDWLSLGGKRQSVAIDLKPCLGHLPCLAEARYASEADDAIPADEFMMLKPEEARTRLYLAPGKYRLRLLGNDSTALAEHELSVPAVAHSPAP